MILNQKRLLQLVAAATILALSSTCAQAQLASAFVREGDAFNINGGTGTVASLSNTAVNHEAGYAVSMNVDDAGNTVSVIYGNAAGGAPAIMRQESTVGDFEQTSFESFFGISDAGNVSYSPSSTRISTNTTGLDGVWLDDVIQAIEEDPAPGGAVGEFTSFGSRPGVTADGKAYWVGGVTNVVGGSTQDRVLYFDGNALLSGGDNIGVPEPVTVGGGIDFDFRFSKFGTNYVSPIDVQSSFADDLVITVNGTVVSPGGNNMREGTLMPMSVGGDGVENWDNFDFMGINEAGDYFVTGDTDNADTGRDEFVSLNGNVVLREGDMVDGLVLSGAIEGGYMNEDTDWAVVWDVDTVGGNVEALIVNGQIALMENDPVDWNGDGVIDGDDLGATITDFSGLSALTLSDRANDGSVTAYFTADAVDASGNVLEGAFAITIPEPSAGAMLLLALVAGLVSRKR